MAIWKLTDTQLPAPSTPFPKKKVFGDGGGLCLVCIGGSKTWQLRYQIANGPTRTMGLGPYPVVSLASAREAARAERAKFKVPGQRVDPIDARKSARTAAALEAARSITFEEACEKYLTAHSRKWADPRGVSDWRSVMKAWVYPIIGATPIADVDRMAVLRVLKQTVEGKPFRDARPKVFQRVAVRIRDVIAWAVVETYRPAGVNPADGHDLKLAFPRVKKDAEVEHRKSLPVEQCPELWRTLNANIETPRVKPLMFAMLTGARIVDAGQNADVVKAALGDPEWTPDVRSPAARAWADDYESGHPERYRIDGLDRYFADATGQEREALADTVRTFVAGVGLDRSSGSELADTMARTMAEVRAMQPDARVQFEHQQRARLGDKAAGLVADAAKALQSVSPEVLELMRKSGALSNADVVVQLAHMAQARAARV